MEEKVTENLNLPLITKDSDIKTVDWAVQLDGENAEGEESAMQKIDAAIGELQKTPFTWGMLKSGFITGQKDQEEVP